MEHRRGASRSGAVVVLAAGLVAAGCGAAGPRLAGRAVLPAETFADGPVTGRWIGDEPIHGRQAPFDQGQPVQGFSGLIVEEDGTLMVTSDNGFGAQENSADYNLRLYRLRADFESGEVELLEVIDLTDPDEHLPFTITNELTGARVLTGADLDVESLRRAPDGTLWLGDEHGPYLIHVDTRGRVLEPPIALPDPLGEGTLRSPQSPELERSAALRLMNAYRAHGLAQGARRSPVLSPHHRLLIEGEAPSVVDREIIDVTSLQRAGFTVVPWTVNDPGRMEELLVLGVDGIITDRPDLLREVLAGWDPDGDGRPDLLDDRGLVDRTRFDLQGHRGARGLRPENTFAAFEAALDELVTTLETDVGLTRDHVPLLSHEPVMARHRCRRRAQEPDQEARPPLLWRRTAAELQEGYVCDGLLPEPFPDQRRDPSLSPVTLAFARERGLPDPYVAPTLAQLFDFIAFYEGWYREGGGAGEREAGRRADNAAQVRLNVEIKRDPRPEAADRVAPVEPFVETVVAVITAAGVEARVDVQSFDHSTLLAIQRQRPSIRTAYLVSDNSLRTGEDGRSPYLAGLSWPWRQQGPVRVATSGGLEGLALSADGSHLMPMLEKPLAGDEPGVLRIFELELGSRTFAEQTYTYRLDERATSVGDFLMLDERRGLVIERDDAEGELGAHKVIYELTLGARGELVDKRLLVDLMALDDPRGLSWPAAEGDLGLGERFAMPFFTIECLAVLDDRHLLVGNDNNYPFSVGRHLGSDQPDDNELVLIRLPQPLQVEERR